MQKLFIAGVLLASSAAALAAPVVHYDCTTSNYDMNSKKTYPSNELVMVIDSGDHFQIVPKKKPPFEMESGELKYQKNEAGTSILMSELTLKNGIPVIYGKIADRDIFFMDMGRIEIDIFCEGQ